MDRLQQHRLALRQRFADADPRRGAEREIRGIHAVIRTVSQRHMDVNDGKAERPAQQSIDHALFHRADIISRHRAADDLFLKLEAAAARHRLDLQHHIAELAVTAGLFLVPAALGDRFADRLLISDRRRLRFDVDAEALAQALQRDPQMHLALSPQHDVVGLRVLDHRQRGVFLVQPQQGLTELDVVLAVGCRDRNRQYRRQRLDARQRRWRDLAARQRVAGLDGVELAERDRVAGLGGSALGVMGAVRGRYAGCPAGLAR